jgi:ATP-binding cassette subfamily F protein 3
MLSTRTERVHWAPDALAVRGLDLAIAGKPLLTNATFHVRKEDRISLMGRNGCGKTSLFRWIGTLPMPPWSLYEVAQELAPSAESITTVVLSAHLERGALWRRQAELEAREELSDAEGAEYTEIGARLDAMRADADPPRAKRILRGLGFQAADLDRPLQSFSGGWRARVALAMGLFMEPDLLLLDEPTNHLDLEGVLWLTEFLKVWPKAVIVISHNVGFLRSISTTQWLLECGHLAVYQCSYARFLQQRQLDAAKQQRDWDLLEREVSTLRGKGTPAAKRAADELFARRTREGVVRPPRPYHPRFVLAEGRGTAGAGARPVALLKTTGAQLGYPGHTVLEDVTFALYGGTRVALVGANGSGKTTLMRFLGGDLAPLAEADREVRTGLRVVKFDQHFYHALPLEQTPADYILSVAASTAFGVPQLRCLLGMSGLEREAHAQSIGTLSGGQKARVYFAAIAAQNPDILLLDEPTNHLDAESIDALAEGLHAFPGAAVVVSHDLEFLERVATEVWQTTGGRLLSLRGEVEEGLETYVNTVVSALEI